MKTLLTTILILLITLGLSPNLSGQNSDKLPRNIPELEGVSSSGIIDFLNAVDTASRVELHSFMFIRHGKVIAEGWWKPYDPDFKHIMFSASKTFTATAIGFAVSENKLKITDKVISFFPYSLPDTISDYIKELTVKNLLTMAVGQDPEPRRNDGDWITGFLSTKPVHKPGTVLMYNNMATFMLSAIVQQVTGQTVFDYLQPRLFQPLAIHGIDWDLSPQGINLGMIGLRLHTEDMAKFGQLLLQNGVWNKKQIIPEVWVKEATSFKIASLGNTSDQKLKDLSDWGQGYCYQMWRGRNNTVRLDGMAGQFVVLIPDKDAIVVFTANARNTQDELNLIHNYPIPAIKSDKALSPVPDRYNELQKRQALLSVKSPFSASLASDMESVITGKESMLQSNDYKIQSVYFAFGKEACTLALKRDNNISTIKAGLENWKISTASSTSLLAAPSGNMPSKSIDANYKISQLIIKVGARYSWTDNRTLEFTGRFVEESLGSETIVCKFSEMNGVLGVTIEPKAASSPMGFPGMARTPVRLRGNLVNIK